MLIFFVLIILWVNFCFLCLVDFMDIIIGLSEEFILVLGFLMVFFVMIVEVFIIFLVFFFEGRISLFISRLNIVVFYGLE